MCHQCVPLPQMNKAPGVKKGGLEKARKMGYTSGGGAAGIGQICWVVLEAANTALSVLCQIAARLSTANQVLEAASPSHAPTTKAERPCGCPRAPLPN